MEINKEDRKINLRFIFSVFKEATHLNIWDLNYFFSNQAAFEWSKLEIESLNKKYQKGIIPQITLYLIRLFRRILWLGQHKKQKTHLDKPILFLGFTKNQIDSLMPLHENCYNISQLIYGSEDYFWNFIVFIGYGLSIFFFPFALRDFFFSRETKHKGILFNFASHWLTYGLYISLRMIFHKAETKLIVLTNDHSMENRVVILVARMEGIKTVYLQHASVTKVFPPLSMDYALLEGIDALSLYEAAGASDTKVFLIGSPKFDCYFEQINRKQSVNSLGICISLFDLFDKVNELIQTIKKKYPNIILELRIHPREKNREVWEKLARGYGINYSDSRSEIVYNFLCRVDAIIACNTNVHLEAAMLNVYPVYMDFNIDNRTMFYSFLEKGLCDLASSADNACDIVGDLLKNKPDIRIRAKNYCDTINTEYDGRSSELASKLISDILQNKSTLNQNWVQFHSAPIKSYRLIDSLGGQ